MKSMHTFACVAIAVTVLAAAAAQDVDGLSEAKKLYESAEYARALTTLEGMDPEEMTPGGARDRLLYQALCLLALGNEAALDSKVREIVLADPFFSPGPEVPPRLRAIVDDMRIRLRPALVQAHYQAGRERFEAGDHRAALQELTLAIRLADDAGTAGAGAVADMRLLAEGFRDLSRRALESPAPAPQTGLPPVPTPEPVVVPPVVIQQQMPAWPASLAHVVGRPGEMLTGVLRIVVGRTGRVESVTVVRRVHPVYDALLVSAARRWKYEPATLNGEPVEFVKQLQVNVTVR